MTTQQARVQGYWKLKDGSYASWKRLVRDPDLQEQLVAKAAFRRTLAKVSGLSLTTEPSETAH